MPKTKLEKQKDAEARSQQRSKRSHKDQLGHLDSLFGPGQGAAKERARLKGLIEGPSKAAKSQPETEGGEATEKPRKKTRKQKQD